MNTLRSRLITPERVANTVASVVSVAQVLSSHIKTSTVLQTAPNTSGEFWGSLGGQVLGFIGGGLWGRGEGRFNFICGVTGQIAGNFLGRMGGMFLTMDGENISQAGQRIINSPLVAQTVNTVVAQPISELITQSQHLPHLSNVVSTLTQGILS